MRVVHANQSRMQRPAHSQPCPAGRGPAREFSQVSVQIPTLSFTAQTALPGMHAAARTAGRPPDAPGGDLAGTVGRAACGAPRSVRSGRQLPEHVARARQRRVGRARRRVGRRGVGAPGPGGGRWAAPGAAAARAAALGPRARRVRLSGPGAAGGRGGPDLAGAVHEYGAGRVVAAAVHVVRAAAACAAAGPCTAKHCQCPQKSTCDGAWQRAFALFQQTDTQQTAWRTGDSSRTEGCTAWRAPRLPMQSPEHHDARRVFAQAACSSVGIGRHAVLCDRAGLQSPDCKG